MGRLCIQSPLQPCMVHSEFNVHLLRLHSFRHNLTPTEKNGIRNSCTVTWLTSVLSGCVYSLNKTPCLSNVYLVKDLAPVSGSKWHNLSVWVHSCQRGHTDMKIHGDFLSQFLVSGAPTSKSTSGFKRHQQRFTKVFFFLRTNWCWRQSVAPYEIRTTP